MLKALSLNLAVLATAAASMAPASAAPPTRHGCDASPQEVKSLRVETEWPKKSFRPGDVAKIKVTVTRPGPKDPLNQGIEIPDLTREPAEGVEVTTAVYNAFPYVASRGETDADGIVVLKLKIPDYLKGWQDTFTDARLYYKTLPGGPDCTDIVERGFKYDVRAFKVKS